MEKIKQIGPPKLQKLPKIIEAMKIEQQKNELLEKRKKVQEYATQISSIPIRIMSEKEREEKDNQCKTTA